MLAQPETIPADPNAGTAIALMLAISVLVCFRVVAAEWFDK